MRINVIDVAYLPDQHLRAEYRELKWVLEKTQTSLTEKVASQNTEPVLNFGIIYLSWLELITIRNN